jgi:hypothetical protein
MFAKSRVETLDHDYLKERLRYNLMTGEFFWKEHQSRDPQWNSRWAGKKAGCVRLNKKSGYKRLRIGLDGEVYTASLLAWFYMLNRWPEGEIDHINHDSLDNRWANLREVPRADNMRNLSRRRDNTSGTMGVHSRKDYKKWITYINHDNKRIHGGYFNSFEEACARRKQLENEYGFHENHGQ